MFLELLVDPTVLFCVSCIVTPLVVVGDDLTQHMVVSYFTEPSMLCSLLAVPLVWVIGKFLRIRAMRVLAARQEEDEKSGPATAVAPPVNYDAMMQPLSYGERTRARWYLLNGLIIHMLMDGCVGVFKTNKLFADNYAKLDRRYADPIGSFNGSAVHIVSMMELFVKGPICVLLYFAFQTRSPRREALEFFTCVTQIYGTIVYLGQEAISGASNLDVDVEMTFSMHYLLYFWFAIFFGCLLYIVVPAVLGWRSYNRLSRQSDFFIRYYHGRRPIPSKVN